MNKKSIVIIGKGPSLVKSNCEFINSFDEVAICNFPPIVGYEQYIGTKADYHFFNAHDPNPYDKKTLNALGLKFIFNTHPKEHPGFKSSFPDHPVKYIKNYGSILVPHFKQQYDFDPSTGIQAYDYFVKKEEYNVIGLVGFDFFRVGQRGYYYPPEQVQETLKYLYNDNGARPFTATGIRIEESSHDSNKSEQYVKNMSILYNKTIRLPNNEDEY